MQFVFLYIILILVKKKLNILLKPIKCIISLVKILKLPKTLIYTSIRLGINILFNK